MGTFAEWPSASLVASKHRSRFSKHPQFIANPGMGSGPSLTVQGMHMPSAVALDRTGGVMGTENEKTEGQEAPVTSLDLGSCGPGSLCLSGRRKPLRQEPEKTL